MRLVKGTDREFRERRVLAILSKKQNNIQYYAFIKSERNDIKSYAKLPFRRRFRDYYFIHMVFKGRMSNCKCCRKTLKARCKNNQIEASSFGG